MKRPVSRSIASKDTVFFFQNMGVDCDFADRAEFYDFTFFRSSNPKMVFGCRYRKRLLPTEWSVSRHAPATAPDAVAFSAFRRANFREVPFSPSEIVGPTCQMALGGRDEGRRRLRSLSAGPVLRRRSGERAAETRRNPRPRIDVQTSLVVHVQPSRGHQPSMVELAGKRTRLRDSERGSDHARLDRLQEPRIDRLRDKAEATPPNLGGSNPDLALLRSDGMYRSYVRQSLQEFCLRVDSSSGHCIYDIDRYGILIRELGHAPKSALGVVP